MDPPLHADDVLDKDVFDVTGRLLGRVRLAREVDDELVSFDIEPRARRRRFGRQLRSTLTVPAAEVVATDFQVSLAQEARYIRSPDSAPHSGSFHEA